MLEKIRENAWVARVALLMNLAGAFLLALSFSATSSDFRLITSPNTSAEGKPQDGSTAYAICANNYALAVTDSHHGIVLGTANCPNWNNSYPAAVVVADHPFWLQTGLILSVLGFLVQFFTVPLAPPKPPVLTRAEIKRILKDRAGT